ncbi:ALF repeat-containing protein [Streptomyces sp. NPDC054834]
MRLNRAALVVAAGALAPALWLSTPSFAVGAAASSVTASVAVTDAGTDADSPYDSMSEDDLRIAILRIVADPATGKAVYREAQKAIDGTAEDMRHFLGTGRRLAQAEDDRVAIATLLADPGISDALRSAAEKAMDGAPEEMRYFLEVGQYEVDG